MFKCFNHLKKTGLSAGFVLFAAPLLAAEGNLNLYNWADYIGENTIANFEKETGIKVSYNTYDSYETATAKLLTGRSGYDLVLLNASLVPPLITAGAFQALDKSKLPSWGNLDPLILKALEDYDPGVTYSAPYSWGSNGITYNVDLILQRMPDAPVNSAAMIFDPKVVSRFADCGISIIDSPTDVLPIALAYLGLNPKSAAADDLKAAQQMMQKIRPYISQFESTNYLNAMAGGDRCMALTWSGDYAVIQERAAESGSKSRFAYIAPKEGTLIWFDSFYMPADAPNVENAYRFIEYLLRPEVIAEFTNFTRYPNANKEALPFVDEDIRNDTGIYPDDEIRARLHTQAIHPPEAIRRITRTWNSIKTNR